MWSHCAAAGACNSTFWPRRVAGDCSSAMTNVLIPSLTQPARAGIF
ncbi:hypothetical protein GMOD_00003851 [Pyrenophora seminiperda CCB06]|uniref:Uncharacterized protein n=1 Tax=Pyrenophora seminiperda CCB06 TaxID=1302712 RepID=A0A3M7LZZ1_9PLEO|nr:hypothetical protein GMOD_00003851 [Pyrenophora seminiperda CCB06]